MFCLDLNTSWHLTELSSSLFLKKWLLIYCNILRVVLEGLDLMGNIFKFCFEKMSRKFLRLALLAWLHIRLQLVDDDSQFLSSWIWKTVNCFNLGGVLPEFPWIKFLAPFLFSRCNNKEFNWGTRLTSEFSLSEIHRFYCLWLSSKTL